MNENRPPFRLSEGLKGLVRLVTALLVACIVLSLFGMSRDLARMLLTTSMMFYCVVYLAAKAACLDGYMAYLNEAMRRSKLIAGRIEQGFICPFYGQGHDSQATVCANCPAREKCKAGTNKETKKETD